VKTRYQIRRIQGKGKKENDEGNKPVLQDQKVNTSSGKTRYESRRRGPEVRDSGTKGLAPSWTRSILGSKTKNLNGDLLRKKAREACRVNAVGGKVGGMVLEGGQRRAGVPDWGGAEGRDKGPLRRKEIKEHAAELQRDSKDRGEKLQLLTSETSEKGFQTLKYIAKGPSGVGGDESERG